VTGSASSGTSIYWNYRFRTNPAKTCWSLDTDAPDSAADLIEAAGGRLADRRDTRWRFAIDNSKTAVPLLVRKFVEAGWAVREIKREDDEFSTVIRRLYTTGNQSSS